MICCKFICKDNTSAEHYNHAEYRELDAHYLVDSFNTFKPFIHKNKLYFLNNYGTLYRVDAASDQQIESPEDDIFTIHYENAINVDKNESYHILASDSKVVTACTSGYISVFDSDLSKKTQYYHKHGIIELTALTDKGLYFYDFNNQINYLDFKTKVYTKIFINKVSNSSLHTQYRSTLATKKYIFVAAGNYIYIFNYNLDFINGIKCTSACQNIKQYKDKVYLFLQNGSMVYFDLNNTTDFKTCFLYNAQVESDNYSLVDIWNEYYILWNSEINQFALCDISSGQIVLKQKLQYLFYNYSDKYLYYYGDDKILYSYNHKNQTIARYRDFASANNQFVQVYFLDAEENIQVFCIKDNNHHSLRIYNKSNIDD